MNNKIQNVPESIYYFPNFISDEDELILLEKVNQASLSKWTQLKNRRLQNWGGIPKDKGMIPEALPLWLSQLGDKIYKQLNQIEGFKNIQPINHVLINEYLPGQGIMAHEDGPIYHPFIFTISLGSHTIINYKPKLDNGEQSDDIYSLLLEPRSLVVVSQTFYSDFTHEIDSLTKDHILIDQIANKTLLKDITEDQIKERETRISLTLRTVKKVNSFKWLKLNR